MQEIDINYLESKIAIPKSILEGHILEIQEFKGDLTLVIQPSSIRHLTQALKQNGFELLLDLFAIDYLKSKTQMPERFAVLYQFYSIAKKHRVRLKAFLNEKSPAIDSIHDLYATVNWFERETWDLYGIQFIGHPNLIRILTHREFVGHPLRKDYPSDGYQQLRRAAEPAEL